MSRLELAREALEDLVEIAKLVALRMAQDPDALVFYVAIIAVPIAYYFAG